MRVGQLRWWIIGGLCLLLCIGVILAAYIFRWSVTGFLNKTVWDWLQLLIVPLVLAAVALSFQFSNIRAERLIAKQRYEQDQLIALDKQREDLLQAYLDRISELLLEKDLRTSPLEEVRNVARVRTTTVLCQLDARRVSYVFAFLREASLMSEKPNSSVVSLSNADLSQVNWSQANLIKADLNGAILFRANLSEASLFRANLSFANLSFANLSGAYLSFANLSGAYLSKAYLSKANLSFANLSEANLSEANLSFANLSEANLSEANLSEANLSGANLSGANLSGADLYNAVISKEQLAKVKPPAKA